jgi:hypothetical protein
MLTGTVVYEGDKTGTIRMDLLTQEGISAPELVSAESVPELGPFSFEVPKNFGDLHILGFIDQQSDGPSEDDPAGKLSVEIGEVDIGELELVLSEDPDLGNLRPGPPPTDQPPQPDGADQPVDDPQPEPDEAAPGEVRPEEEGGPPPEEAPAEEPLPEEEAPPSE